MFILVVSCVGASEIVFVLSALPFFEFLLVVQYYSTLIIIVQYILWDIPDIAHILEHFLLRVFKVKVYQLLKRFDQVVNSWSVHFFLAPSRCCLAKDIAYGCWMQELTCRVNNYGRRLVGRCLASHNTALNVAGSISYMYVSDYNLASI